MKGKGTVKEVADEAVRLLDIFKTEDPKTFEKHIEDVKLFVNAINAAIRSNQVIATCFNELGSLNDDKVTAVIDKYGIVTIEDGERPISDGDMKEAVKKASEVHDDIDDAGNDTDAAKPEGTADQVRVNVKEEDV